MPLFSSVITYSILLHFPIFQTNHHSFQLSTLNCIDHLLISLLLPSATSSSRPFSPSTNSNSSVHPKFRTPTPKIRTIFQGLKPRLHSMSNFSYLLPTILSSVLSTAPTTYRPHNQDSSSHHHHHDTSFLHFGFFLCGDMLVGGY